MNKESDRIRYYNLSFVNLEGFPQQATAVETRTTPIIEKANDWLMSVVRFDVDSSAIPINLPLMFIDPITGIPSTTQTRSTVFITYHGGTFSADVNYVPPPLILPPLNLPAIYDYQTWLDFVNTALAAALTASGAPGSPPLLIFNPVTGLINLYVDENYIPAAGANKIVIGINQVMYQYFNNFEYIYSPSTGLTNNAPFYFLKFKITDSNTLKMPAVGSRAGLPNAVQGSTVPPVLTNLYMYSQLAPGTGAWSSLRSIILTSNLIPYQVETITSNPGLNANYASSNLFPIISDFLVPMERNVTEFRLVNEYLPTAEYRRVNLVGNGPLNTIDLKMYWTDFQGNIYPLYLQTSAGMSVKILFERKTL